MEVYDQNPMDDEILENKVTYEIVSRSEASIMDHSSSTHMGNLNDAKIGYEKLNDMAQQQGMHIVDVPADGNCLFASVMQDLKKEISFAPAEHEKPVPLLSDANFEELANPEKYPDGKNALTAERSNQIDARRYFNQRLLDVDGK